jgi:uncharacterized damage-inducible protein DinB
MSELAHAWRIHCGLNTMLLDAIPDASLADRYSPRTRSVASQFAHMHNVRVMHLEKRFAAEADGLQTFERGAEPTRAELSAALDASDRAMARALAAAEDAGKLKSWKGPPASFLGYLVSHESHHRGLALVCLRVGGTKLGKDVTYGIWNWSKDWEASWDDDWLED